jgi:hypothetical protein
MLEEGPEMARGKRFEYRLEIHTHTRVTNTVCKTTVEIRTPLVPVVMSTSEWAAGLSVGLSTAKFSTVCGRRLRLVGCYHGDPDEFFIGFINLSKQNMCLWPTVKYRTAWLLTSIYCEVILSSDAVLSVQVNRSSLNTKYVALKPMRLSRRQRKTFMSWTESLALRKVASEEYKISLNEPKYVLFDLPQKKVINFHG